MTVADAIAWLVQTWAPPCDNPTGVQSVPSEACSAVRDDPRRGQAHLRRAAGIGVPLARALALALGRGLLYEAEAAPVGQRGARKHTVNILLLNSAGEELARLNDWHHVPRVGEFVHYEGKQRRVAEVHYLIEDDVVPIGHGNNQVILALEDGPKA